MNVKKDLKILRKTEYQALIKNIEEQVRYNRRLGIALVFMYLFLILLVVAFIFPPNFEFLSAVIVLFSSIGTIISFITALVIDAKGSEKIELDWHVLPLDKYIWSDKLSKIVILAVFLLSSIYLVITYPIMGFFIFAIIFFLFIINKLPILQFIKYKKLSLSKLFIGPYSQDDLLKIQKAFEATYGNTRKNKWGNGFVGHYKGLEIKFTPTKIPKNLRIRVTIKNVDENTAPQFKGVVEKIEEIMLHD